MNGQYAAPSTLLGAWPSSGSASTFWLTHDFSSWGAALHEAERMRPHLLGKPRISRDGDRWRLRYQPRVMHLNGVA